MGIKADLVPVPCRMKPPPSKPWRTARIFSFSFFSQESRLAKNELCGEMQVFWGPFEESEIPSRPVREKPQASEWAEQRDRHGVTTNIVYSGRIVPSCKGLFWFFCQAVFLKRLQPPYPVFHTLLFDSIHKNRYHLFVFFSAKRPWN